MLTFVNKYNYVLTEEMKEQGDSQTLHTVQNQSISVSELLLRFSRGVMPNAVRNAVYIEGANLEDLDMEKLMQMDEVQKLELSKKAIANLEHDLEHEKKQIEAKRLWKEKKQQELADLEAAKELKQEIPA